MNLIEWTSRALKQASKIQKKDRTIIVNKIETLENWPKCQNVKALKTGKYPYRLKVGDFRVFFTADTSIRIVRIEEVKKRNERTY